MNKRYTKVMSMLKPKVKAFGFNQKELKGLAAEIAENLTSAEDASDEDVNAEIENSIEAVLPILKLGQSYANRVINQTKNEVEENSEDSEDDEEEVTSKSTKSAKTKEKKSTEVPEWAQALIESNKSLSEQLQALKGEKVADSRRARLEKLLKNTGAYGSSIMKSFAKAKFEDDEDFDEFFTGVEEDLKILNQERNNAGLALLGNTTGPSVKDKKPEVLSEDEIKAIAQM